MWGRRLPPPGWERAGAGVVRRLARAFLIAFALASPPVLAAGAVPQRVVSFNLCADQLVLALADPSQIAALSPYAADPTLSVMAKEAEKYPRLAWQAESVMPLNPDLVLIGSWDRAVTRRLLTALKFKIAELDVVLDIDAVRAQIRQVADLLGHPERGARLVADLDAARARLMARPPPTATTALVVERGGFTAGTDTLVAALLADAGLHAPPGAPASIGGYVPLERLLVLKPDVIVFKERLGEARDQGALYLTHPALRALYPPERQIILPERYTLCGGPALVAAYDYLAAAMDRLSPK